VRGIFWVVEFAFHSSFFLFLCVSPFCSRPFFLRIFKIIDTKPNIPYKGGHKPSTCYGEISFQNISFTYPARTDIVVLKDFSFEVKPNQTVALVGQSGSGKSTLLCLLERFYDVQEGNIMIDGKNIKDLDPLWLHQNIAIVPQEPVLFSGTIRSNIA
jgi:ATP-binding cassette subfamily B (MDR/TAP) protein 1